MKDQRLFLGSLVYKVMLLEEEDMDKHTCWFCGRNGACDHLDKHHIFGGAYRKKSEKYGLTVYLCHNDCHIFGKYAAHNNKATMQMLHEYGQKKAMAEQGWTVERFIKEFGKNYLQGGE